MLEIPHETVVIERGDVMRAKPEPDLFLACQERLGVHIRDCFVIGDAVWDLLAARRAGMLSVGVLSGGYGAEELIRAGAFRVYRDARELDESLDELGVLSCHTAARTPRPPPPGYAPRFAAAETRLVGRPEARRAKLHRGAR